MTLVRFASSLEEADGRELVRAPGYLADMAFLHWSPKRIPIGAFVVPASVLGGPSRSFGGNYTYAIQLGIYAPNRVYVMQTINSA